VNPATTRLIVVHVIHRLDRRRVLLTTPSTCRGEIFWSQSLWQSSMGKYPNFWQIPKFPYNTVWDRWKEASTPTPARFVHSFRYNTVLWRTAGHRNRRTDRQTHDDSKYHARLASRCKKQSTTNQYSIQCIYQSVSRTGRRPMFLAFLLTHCTGTLLYTS